MVPGMWGFAGTAMASLMFFRSMYSQFVPCELQAYIEKFVYKMMGWVSIKFNEYTGEGLQRSKAYDSIRHYLSATSTAHTQRMKANESRSSKSLVLSMDDHEEVEEFFEGVKVKWCSSKSTNLHVPPSRMDFSKYPKSYHVFHQRMYKLVEDPSTDSIISWSKHNNSFVIWNQDELVRRKMICRFYSDTFTEFISELKCNLFVRGKPELLAEMQFNSVMKPSKTIKAEAEVIDIGATLETTTSQNGRVLDKGKTPIGQ
ncbi:unnamed protein product [Thlaspi arvense]|uniref:HSF-type DNA-binding domain-containing protein n=1 Tax=Thlaspi arvense TaxID=13288 RepID=A0AAU9TB61_THLAR|nr:unnamed protein product [Thlaspi arvense]